MNSDPLFFVVFDIQRTNFYYISPYLRWTRLLHVNCCSGIKSMILLLVKITFLQLKLWKACMGESRPLNSMKNVTFQPHERHGIYVIFMNSCFCNNCCKSKNSWKLHRCHAFHGAGKLRFSWSSMGDSLPCLKAQLCPNLAQVGNFKLASNNIIHTNVLKTRPISCRLGSNFLSHLFENLFALQLSSDCFCTSKNALVIVLSVLLNFVCIQSADMLYFYKTFKFQPDWPLLTLASSSSSKQTWFDKNR